MELLYRSQETRKFYKKFNKSRNGPVPRAEMYRDKDGSLLTDGREVIKRWKQHFDEHLNGAENVGMGVQDDGGNDYVSAAGDGNDPAPTLREVKDTMHQLKTNKASCKDGIAAELIKMGPEKLATSTGGVEGRGNLSHSQKGDHLECENFRAITILNAAYKSSVVYHLKRMSYQAGFIDGRSITDQIFTAAYDSIDRTELWKIMDENSFPGKLTRMVKTTMDGVQNCVRVLGELSSSFGSRRGLRQGDGLSCLLFNIALEGVMRRAGINSRAKVGLVVKASKTNYMLVGGTKHGRIRLGSNVTIDGDTFEVVEEFVYLGFLLTADNNVSREIRRRIISGSRAYYGLQKNLRSKKIHPRTKCTMYKTLIRPVIRYGHEPWIMLEEDLQALGVFELRVLRTIFDGAQENGVWRRRMNHELAAPYGEPSIQKVAKAGRIRWAGYVARMPDNNPSKLVFATNPFGTRKRGAQRARWVEQVERDLASIGRDRGWREAATNRVLWRTFVDYVLS
ncbi:uncharacterized protein LOC131433845 [Malaya genurostris]|uniref:uncharacterized protein LOC131433845 n=1 Tax=Malaya genurostris TaxID=325434 RepID=UPI0026F3929C|nr:uncharacterized protein LOC131433845 [Malaya genurostris]